MTNARRVLQHRVNVLNSAEFHEETTMSCFTVPQRASETHVFYDSAEIQFVEAPINLDEDYVHEEELHLGHILGGNSGHLNHINRIERSNTNITFTILRRQLALERMQQVTIMVEACFTVQQWHPC